MSSRPRLGGCRGALESFRGPGRSHHEELGRFGLPLIRISPATMFLWFGFLKIFDYLCCRISSHVPFIGSTRDGSCPSWA